MLPYMIDIPNHKGGDGSPDPIIGQGGKDPDNGGTLDQYRLQKIEKSKTATQIGTGDPHAATGYEVDAAEPVNYSPDNAAASSSGTPAR